MTSSNVLCEALLVEKSSSKNNRANDNKFLFRESRVREAVLKKKVSISLSHVCDPNNSFLHYYGGWWSTQKMTSIGRFSIKSESADNLSIPTFFLALSGQKTSRHDDAELSSVHASISGAQQKFTVSDFESVWLNKDMPNRHPRFHSTVSAHDDRYFEEVHHINPGDKEYSKIKAELDRHASETMHFSVYRDDLRHRIEQMLTSPIEVQDKLWEVKISNGPLGSSGAISRAKVEAILSNINKERGSLTRHDSRGDEFQRKKYGAGKVWSGTARKVAPIESVLLFRSHHALADGASIMAALSDLSDEAEEIREEIGRVLKRWKRKGSKKSLLRYLLSRIVRYFKMCVWFTLGAAKAFGYQMYLQVTTRQNPFDAVRKHAEKQGLLLHGRSISWCDAAPLEEAKQICHAISETNGVNITINDLFVSCVTAAIVRQLNEHHEFMAPIAPHKYYPVTEQINVVVPVHLRGGVVLPGESVGNRIGAFVTRCPGEMAHVGEEAAQSTTRRLLEVNKSLSYSKSSPAPLVSHYFAKFCSDYLPESWTQSLFRKANANGETHMNLFTD